MLPAAGKGERLNYLDAVRGLAALVVVFYHCWTAMVPAFAGRDVSLGTALRSGKGVLLYVGTKVVYSGRSAVILFFVLSGFVLAYSLLRRPTPYVQYALRRIFRIYPAFVFVITLSYALHAVIGFRHEVGSEWLHQISNPPLSCTLWIQHLMMVGTSATITLDGVMWSLVQEMRLSLLFPLVLLSVCKYGWRAVAFYLVLSVASSEALLYMTGSVAIGYVDRTFAETLLETSYFAVFFALGSYLALQRKTAGERVANLPLAGKAALSLAVLGCLVKAGYGAHEVLGPVSDYLRGLGAVGLLALALGLRHFREMLSGAILGWLGRISYSLYLVHVPVIYVVTQTFGSAWPAAEVVAVAVALSFAVAELISRFIEFPFIRLGKRVSASLPFAASTQAK